MMHPNFPRIIWAARPWGIFDSMWSQKDWVPANFALQLPIYWTFVRFCARWELLGLIRRQNRLARLRARLHRPNRSLAPMRIALWSGGGGASLTNCGGVFVLRALFVHWGWFEGGRYLLASLGGLMLLLARGWRGWLGERAFAALPVVLTIALLLFNVLTIYQLIFYLNPLARAGTP